MKLELLSSFISCWSRKDKALKKMCAKWTVALSGLF